ncbi:MAG: SRPBCC family protein [Prevotella sp.]|jgi:carbon monoxide dehydrogenase subunit G|nr:SRPBCC family protein [Prevotella sp.]
MTKYESDVKQIAATVEQVYQKLSNLENLRPILENAQDNEALKARIEAAGQDSSHLEKLKDVRLTADSIAIPAPMVGEIALRIIEREENKTVKFETEQSPIQANMWIQVLPTSEVTTAEGQQGTKMRLTLKADLNPMVKMMVGSKLQDGINKFADMLAMLNYC